jgi:hypothetical protein
MKKIKKYQKGEEVKPTTRDQQVVRKKLDPSDPALKGVATKILNDTTSRGFEPARASGKPSMSSFDPKRAGSSKKPVNDRGWATPANGDRKAEDLFKNPYKKGGSVTALNKVQEMYSKKKK